MNRLLLKPGKEKSLARRHPWVFSGAIAEVRGAPGPGETVEIVAADGRVLGLAAYSPQSQIRARVWTWEAGEAVDAAFFRRRIDAALALRRALIPPEAGDGLRLVHGESDGLPGVVCDRYGDTLVLQLLAAGAERWRAELAQALEAATGAAALYERSDAEVRGLEGLPSRCGPVLGEAPADALAFSEYGLACLADVVAGHKTGFYLDQRENRRLVRRLAQDRDVLNCFSYTGAFSVAALAGGARSVLSIDSSGPALALACRQMAANGLDPDRAQWLEADAFQSLRRLRDQGRRFDLVVLDPPKFAPTAAHAERAARAYKDVNLQALRLLRPGGLLLSFSCSGGVSADLFQKIVAGAAADARMEAAIVGRLGPGADHPVALAFPEGDYLKGLLLRAG